MASNRFRLEVGKWANARCQKRRVDSMSNGRRGAILNGDSGLLENSGLDRAGRRLPLPRGTFGLGSRIVHFWRHWTSLIRNAVFRDMQCCTARRRLAAVINAVLVRSMMLSNVLYSLVDSRGLCVRFLLLKLNSTTSPGC